MLSGGNAKDKIKAGGGRQPWEPGCPEDSPGDRGEGEAGRRQGRVLWEGRSSSSEVGRGSPVSLRHNRRPLSSEQSELGETAAKRGRRGSLTPQGIVRDPCQAHFWGTCFQDSTRRGSVNSKKEGSGKADTRVTAEGTWRCLGWGKEECTGCSKYQRNCQEK